MKQILLKLLLAFSSLIMFLIVVESALYLFDINSQQTEILHEFYNSGESAPILQKIPRFKSIEKNMITNDIKPINKDENIFHISFNMCNYHWNKRINNFGKKSKKSSHYN